MNKQDKHVLIVENGPSPLEKINESANTGNKFLLNGIFTEFNVQNRNNRFYTSENFIPCMQKLLEKKKTLGVIFGEFDHPDVFDIAGKNVSHAIENLSHNTDNNRIDGTIALLSTTNGKEARAIINDGYPIFVSSRAAGVTDQNGYVSLKELFTYDIVVDPGFASTRMSINESLGFSNTNVPYRIYEMNDNQVNKLFNDNKNDKKTEMDLTHMQQILDDERAKIKFEIMETINNSKYAPEEVNRLLEKYETVNSELTQVKEYLDTFKKSIQYLVKENKELTKKSEALTKELNENTLYANHISEGVKKVDTESNVIKERIEPIEKMLEYVAEHTKANILFTEYIAKNLNTNINETKDVAKFAEYVANETKINAGFLEYVANESSIIGKFAEQVANESNIIGKFAEQVANETKNTQQFSEYIANETKNTQKFSEYIANETKNTQQFSEYVANEVSGDSAWLNYIAEKVDGIVGYNKLVGEVLNGGKVNESKTIKIVDIEDFVGITEEKTIVNNIKMIKENDELDTEENEFVQPVEGQDNLDNEENEENDEPTIDNDMASTEEVEDFSLTEQPIENDVVVDDTTIDTSIETQLLSQLVKIFGTDETGVVLEITPDNKVVIQKSGSDETMEYGMEDFEVINTDDNITETVTNILDEIKKQKVLANTKPHFFSFLSEEQITDFKCLAQPKQEQIILSMNEAEYMCTEDVLSIIGSVLNESGESYEEKLISNIPTSIKETWNGLEQSQKLSVIAESKYFALNTKADIKSFWETRPFVKAVNGTDAVLIKESANLQTNEDLSDNYIQSFMESIDKLNGK